MTLRIKNSFISNVALASATAAAIWASNASALELPDINLPELNGNYYGGVGYGSSSIEPRVNASGYTVTDSADSGIQLFLGRDITKRLSVEGYYSNMGTAELDNGTVSGGIDYSTFGASGLLYLIGAGGADALAARRGFNVYGRLGFGKLNNEGSGIPFNRVNDWHYSAGLGAEYSMANGFGIRAEFNNFDSDARMVTLNIVKRFSYRGSNAIPLLSNSDLAPDGTEKLTVRTDRDGDGVRNTDDLCADTAEGTPVDASGCAFTGVLEGVTFATGASKLTDESIAILDKVVAGLKKNPEIEVSVEAHTDSSGSAKANMALSRKRAGSVANYLVNVGRIDISRLTAIGFGESRPRQSNKTEAGREANRRVEIKTQEQ